MVTSGHIKQIFIIIKNRTYSNTYWYFVRRDLNLGLIGEVPKTKIDIKLRPYKSSDHQYFSHLILDDMLLNANIPTCYVAVTNEDVPCFRQWLIEPSQNEKIKGFFGDNFPLLAADECIFERAYAVKEYRGMNLYPTVNYILGKKALDLGYRWVVACIDINNAASLKAALKLETRPYKLQITKWRFFTRKVSYTHIPEKLKKQNPWLFPDENS
ncbi:hypothetical protein EV196_106223 [Mariniflexile fucanivorans]|uniref:Acetyltransferase (GNAT) family protein n=2 Tax=Mariniflexile fucanivorans TaxID=264023 RepID=A0A4R1RHG6_9FLAO|nr:hypothetical protein EV196_106223 [Mariniflexile fucanivorans]